jgi:PKD repeat protein
VTSDHLVIWLAGYWDRVIGRSTAIGLSAAIGLSSIAISGCSLSSPKVPDLSGPSEMSTSIAMAATPDLVARDGAMQSVVTVTVRDAQSQPVRNLALRMDVKIGGALGDLGTLSSRNISTGSDGRASVIYTAPPPAAFGATNEATIQIVATPVGTDAANTTTSAVSIRLTSPGVIQPPNSAPVPSFFFSPTSPKERESVLFDGSASKDPDGKIMSYVWNFGDGETGSGQTVTHLYGIAATYQPTLTVTDDRGLSVTSAPRAITVGSASNPVASFFVSPSSVRIGETLNFNATASTVPPGRLIESWQWDFGDGTSSTAGPVTTHAYAVAKTYTVLLTVTDTIGRRDTFTLTVTINP